MNKDRKVCWVFAIYEGIEIRRAYFMPPGSLEAYFRQWESKWIEEQKDINNPKIQLTFITQHRELVYSDQKTLHLNNTKAVRPQLTKHSRNLKDTTQIARASDRERIHHHV